MELERIGGRAAQRTRPNGDEVQVPRPSDALTLPAFFRAIGRSFGDRVAVDDEHRVLTYRELDERSKALGKQLLARGATKGARIGLLLPNGPEFVVTFAAITRIGAVAVPLSTLMRGRELGRVIRHADLLGLIGQRQIMGHDFVEQLVRAFPELESAGPSSSVLVMKAAPYLRWIVLSGGEIPPWARDPSWLEAADDSAFTDELVVEMESEVSPADLAFMIYTSGQSADPKGVTHSHGGALGQVHAVGEMMGVTSDARAEAALPFFWVGGLALTVLTTLQAGGTIVCPTGPAAKVPPLGAVHRLITDEPPPGYVAFPSLGMTETFAMYAWGKVSAVPGRNYVPIDLLTPGYEVKVVDPEGRRVGEGERGEILVRGAALTPGYYKVPRSRNFDSDGYFHTGDDGEVEGSRIHFIGRMGDMIKTRMANVSPPEVERELIAIPGVAGAYVVALDDPVRGQTVASAVIPEPGATLDVGAITHELRQQLSPFKVPRVIVFLSEDEVPLTPSNKVNKRELASLIAERAQVMEEPSGGRSN